MPKQKKGKDNKNQKWDSYGEDNTYLYSRLLDAKNKFGWIFFIAENKSLKDKYVQRNLSNNIWLQNKIYNTLKMEDVSYSKIVLFYLYYFTLKMSHVIVFCVQQLHFQEFFTRYWNSDT